MAAEGGGFKPGDFYIGVVELFAILLPGMIVTYLVWGLCQQSLIENGGAPLHNFAPPGDAAGYLTFAVLSYVVGHFLAAFGWVFMDTVFEAQHDRRTALTRKLLDLESRTTIVVKQRLNLTEGDDLFPRALAYIDIHYATAAGKLEAMEADCKSFRNLIPALLLSLPIIHGARCQWSPDTVADTVWILCFFVYVAVASFFYRRFRTSRPPTGTEREPRICWGITSPLGLLVLLATPVIINIVLALCLLDLHQLVLFLLIDLGILLAALLAIVRYMLLQLKRMAAAYNYLLSGFDPLPHSA